MKARFTSLVLCGLLSCLLSSGAPGQASRDARNPQYGFAHRANDWDVIVDVLDASKGGGSVAGNGIELDIGWSTYYKDWIVSHDSFGIAQPASEYLHEWLGELKKQLATRKYDNSFAALWVDIKTPNEQDLMKVVQLVRANVPSSVAVIYDVGGKENLGFLEGDSKGYDAIKHQLRSNEGLGIWVGTGETGWVSNIYNKLKADGITRSVVHHGHAANIDETVLAEINKPEYHRADDPYRFKKVFTWTNNRSSTMEKYVNPANSYHTDGQIVGAPMSEWYGNFGDLQDFDNAVAKHATTQRKAVRSDPFWTGSGASKATSPTSMPTAPGKASNSNVLKNGDVLVLQAPRGYLSWYPGNWVVLEPVTTLGNAQKWRVENLRVVSGRPTFRLRNVHSKTLLDGQYDNDVVLDTSASVDWYSRAASLTAGSTHVIWNSGYKGAWAMADRGDSKRAYDVKLRKAGTAFTLIRVAK